MEAFEELHLLQLEPFTISDPPCFEDFLMQKLGIFSLKQKVHDRTSRQSNGQGLRVSSVH